MQAAPCISCPRPTSHFVALSLYVSLWSPRRNSLGKFTRGLCAYTWHMGKRLSVTLVRVFVCNPRRKEPLVRCRRRYSGWMKFYNIHYIYYKEAWAACPFLSCNLFCDVYASVTSRFLPTLLVFETSCSRCSPDTYILSGHWHQRRRWRSTIARESCSQDLEKKKPKSFSDLNTKKEHHILLVYYDVQYLWNIILKNDISCSVRY